jgi:hypothetical protein
LHNIALIGAGRIHGANVVAHPGLALSHIVDPLAGNTEAAAQSLTTGHPVAV